VPVPSILPSHSHQDDGCEDGQGADAEVEPHFVHDHSGLEQPERWLADVADSEGDPSDDPQRRADGEHDPEDPQANPSPYPVEAPELEETGLSLVESLVGPGEALDGVLSFALQVPDPIEIVARDQ
jgi:hypothetical protein